MNNNHFVEHHTFAIERHYHVSPATVFAAWADPVAKSKWFPQAEQFEFRVGGREFNRGGGTTGPIYTFDARYEEIVKDLRIVYSYIMDREKTPVNKVRISASLTTVEFKTVEDGTRLIYTEQAAFLDGHDTPDLRMQGTHSFLNQLGEYLESV
ncbi:SRPBCC family protein [Paenibacillus daejeonensis]|uniref:SRPBCC family protein n=1 Tax=Paenibacillus daejeonensis TaxID=135193 RepID=UPI000373C3B8|nr:SRPBCC family protein [Paenibacillus daejeonensis]